MWQVFFPVEAETGTVGLPFFARPVPDAFFCLFRERLQAANILKKRKSGLAFGPWRRAAALKASGIANCLIFSWSCSGNHLQGRIV